MLNVRLSRRLGSGVYTPAFLKLLSLCVPSYIPSTLNDFNIVSATKEIIRLSSLLLLLTMSSLSFATPADDFVITIKTDNLSNGSSSTTQFTIPTTGGGYNYNVDCNNNGSNEAIAQTGNYTCNYDLAGMYTIRIKDNAVVGTGFPRIYINNSGDRFKITSLDQWGTGKWANMAFAFFGAENMIVAALDTPDFSAVTSMRAMFGNAIAANPDTSLWNVEAVETMANMFFGVTLPTASYDVMLMAFDAQNLKPNVSFHGGNSKYCIASVARANMISSDSWIISDGGSDCINVAAPNLQAASDTGFSDSDDVTDVILPSFDVVCSVAGNIIKLYSDNPASNTLIGTHNCNAAATETITATTSLAVATHNISYTETELGLESTHSATLLLTIVDNVSDLDFVMTVNTAKLSSGSSSATQFNIPTFGSSYNYSVDCDAANPGTNISALGQTGDYTCNYASAGSYTLRIKDNTGLNTGFPRIYFNNGGDRLKITSLDQWGEGKWTDMAFAFFGASNMVVSAVDTPDFSAVASMRLMFGNASVANPDTTHWDTSAVTNMENMFNSATSANPDTSGWNIEAVTDMTSMFFGVTLPTASYDAILMGFNAQTLQPNVNFSGGNSKYCNAASTRANMISSDGWNIIDGGTDCINGISPDLQAVSDSGVSDSDNVTTIMLPSFDVVCFAASSIITLYSDNPEANTSMGSQVCSAVGTETITTITSLVLGMHNISYTETIMGVESAHSITLAVQITLIDDKDKDGLTDADEATLGTDPLDPDTDGDQIEDGLDDVPLISSNTCVGANAIFTDVVTSDITCAATTSVSVEAPSEVQTGHLKLIAPLVIFNSGFTAGRLSVKTQDPCASCGP